MSYEFMEGMVLAFALVLLGVLVGCLVSLFYLKPPNDGDGWDPWDDFDREPDPSPEDAKR